MSENIITTATFGQSKDGNKEEEPIIVAQRFLNIFRQLHIFSEDNKKEFNRMLLELPKSVLSMFRTLPGGSVLLEYLEELQPQADLTFDDVKSAPSAATPAAKESMQSTESSDEKSAPQPVQAVRYEGINEDNFAKVLASSLAQSNAQIIRELQNNRPAPQKSEAISGDSKSPMKLVADETFTQTIAKALAEALAASEQKRQEDNKIITQSFLELQENLNKIVEQNNQLKIISNSEAPAEAASTFQLKNVVDDLVKAQSKFLRETTQSQKEEMSAAISTAIKESLKMSTQSLIDGFKQIDSENGPTPITYAASSPKNQLLQSNIEEALKAQGKEFSSIISSALRESQQTSAQTIAQTIASLKDTTASQNDNAPRVEDIMKMQAALFRDITQAQNREFSHLISNALQESQKQSTQAIIEALNKMQPVVKSEPVVVPLQVAPQPEAEKDKKEALPKQPTETKPSLKPETIVTPAKDLAPDKNEDTPGGKKKKKKKKNQNANNNISKETPVVEKPLQKVTSIVSALPEMPVVNAIPANTSLDLGFGVSVDKPDKEEIEKTEDIVATADNNTEDWTWDYEEVPGDEKIEGKEGQDWEWDYEEVPDDGNIDGQEGQDWEWAYEEVPDESATDNEALLSEPDRENIVERSEIILPSNFEILLIGMEDSKFQDPYLENQNNMG